MRQMMMRSFGGPEVLKLEQAPLPTPEPGQALVRVRAAAVNPLDATVRNGWFPMAQKPPLVLGNEGAGILEADTATFKRGARVMVWGGFGVAHDGTWREYVAAQPHQMIPVPDNLSFEEAAAVPVAFVTAQLALTQNGFRPGHRVLVPAAGGSVSNAALQLARAQGGQVVTTASTAEKASKARAQGFDVVDLTSETLADGVRRLTGGRGADLVLDAVGGSVLGQALAALADGGTLVSIGYVAGTQAGLDILDLLVKGVRVVGFNLFKASAEEMAAALGTILKLLADGTVKPVVDRVFPLAEAGQAQEYLGSRKAYGKVILSL